MPEDRTEKNKAIDLALMQIEKQFGKGSIMRLGSKERFGAGGHHPHGGDFL